MALELVVLSLESRQPTEVGRAKGERTYLGRECPGGISIPTAGVSRQHGEIIQVKSQYLYRDLGSTNGSWVNGEKVNPDRPRIVRPGDSLQLAAAPLRIAPNPMAQKISSLVVLKDGAALDEFPIPQTGPAIKFGGPASDITQATDLPELCVIETRDGGLRLTVAEGASVMLNGAAINGSIKLKDNDVVESNSFQIVINVPDRGGELGIAATQRLAASNFGSMLGDSQSSEIEQTIAIDRTQALNIVVGSESHPQNRFGQGFEPAPSALGLSPLEVKLVILMGVMLVFAVIVIAIWWLSQN